MADRTATAVKALKSEGVIVGGCAPTNYTCKKKVMFPS